MANPYDVFISYSSEDKDWADKLYQDLRRKGLDVFLDRPELHPGGRWREELLDTLRSSQYFVALWSKKARASEWVSHESVEFQSKLATPDGGLSRRRRMIFILLDDDHKPYDYLQMIHDVKEAGVYTTGIAQMEQDHPNLWPGVVDHVYRSLKEDEEALSIPLLLLTTTKDRLSQIDFNAVPDFIDTAEPLGSLLQRIGLSREDLLSRYGDDRDQWKPIGSPCHIMTLLSQHRDYINVLPQSIKFRWEPIGEKFWTGIQDEIEAERRKLLSPHLGVVVVDPLALYVGKVYNRFNRIRDCFDNENAVIIVLPPFPLPDTVHAFREGIQKLAINIYKEHYEPGIRGTSYANCSFNFGDDLGIRRSLLGTLTKHFHRSSSTAPRYVYQHVERR